jgi:hypothetical protein
MAGPGDDFLHLHDVHFLLPGGLPVASIEAALGLVGQALLPVHEVNLRRLSSSCRIGFRRKS